MNSIVEVERLTKSYGSVAAVDNVSFVMEAERIYGLLGRNGAGKTTIMQLVTAQLFPTSGDIRVFGERPFENSRVLGQIAFIKESQKYPAAFRVADVLAMAALLYPEWDRDYAATLVEDFQLPLARKVKALSRGMLSSVGIIVGLASRAPLTIFDEPYLGLDAVARSLFYNRLIEDFGAHPRTIVLSTHLIDEVSRILDHVLVVDRGRLILDEETETLRGRAFSVAGSASGIAEYTAGRNVLDRHPLGGLVSATVLGTMDTDDRRHAKSLDLELVPISLQQLIVHLTGDKSEPALEEAVR
ncbi:MAG TPA: ABC transporter ATP-binding protein [Ktedonobacterales bacterium]|jgi:ABC-2 type transport system ATP-binding protein